MDPGRDHGHRGGAPVRQHLESELLARRVPGGSRAPSRVRLDAERVELIRVEPAPVFRGRVAVGEAVRHRRAGAAVAFGAAGSGRRTADLSVRPRAGLAAGRAGGGRVRGRQPVHDLVLAGGTRVHAADRAVHGLAAVLRPRLEPWRRRARPAVVGGALSAGAADAVLRGLSDRGRGPDAHLPRTQPGERARARRPRARRARADPARGAPARPARAVHRRRAAVGEDSAGPGHIRDEHSVRERRRDPLLRTARSRPGSPRS